MSFQGSEHSGARIRIYRRAGATVEILGRASGPDDLHLAALSTTKAMGAGSGSFNATIKLNDFARLPDLSDDDWVDVSFVRNNEEVHELRGLLESVGESESASASGTTQRSVSLSGRDHGAVFEKTQIFYNAAAGELASLGAARALQGAYDSVGTPDVVVKALLDRFLWLVEESGRGNFALPQSVPNSGVSLPLGDGDFSTFTENYVLDAEEFTNPFTRVCPTQQFTVAQDTSVWALAQEYSDPAFTELFTTLEPNKSEDAAIMKVIFRDKPFPTEALGPASPWYQLPKHVIPRQHIRSRDLARSTADRVNAFVVSPTFLQGAGGNARNLVYPLWNTDSIRDHGLRLREITSMYRAGKLDLLGLGADLRNQMRDWHCLGHEFWSGSVQVARLYPNIRIGERLEIPAQYTTPTETFYIEQVDKSWAPGKGSTLLGVTRGWRGSEESYRRAVREEGAKYVEGRGNG